MLTTENAAAIIAAPFNNKNGDIPMASVKLINIGEIPFAVKGSAVYPGETFEEEGIAVK